MEGHVVGGEAAVEGHQAIAGFEAGEHGFERLGAVAHEDPNAVPLLETRRAEGPGQGVGPPVQLGIAQRSIAPGDRRAVTEPRRALGEQLADVHGRHP